MTAPATVSIECTDEEQRRALLHLLRMVLVSHGWPVTTPLDAWRIEIAAKP